VRALLAIAIALLLAPPALAQPDRGIARPDNERGMSLDELGAQLFSGNCPTCHGIAGRGKADRGPPLLGVGARSVDFYLRTGYMPLSNPHRQPSRRRPPFEEREIKALVAYVASLRTGPPIPHPNPAGGSVAEGFGLFTQHCAGCHQVAAQGGVVTGARVPPLEDATPVQIAQAVRIGPYLMPRFGERQISDAQLDSIIAYVERAKHPVDRGGWGIGNVGPVPEGMVTWLIAILILLATCMAIGQRVRS
jgi:ubiquinol-cytochrome c reductase cytochrome c subunit